MEILDFSGEIREILRETGEGEILEKTSRVFR
jgi:hypothetical protein